jgi:diamine N-acetyltransferase
MDIHIRLATSADYPSFLRVAREVHEHHVAAVPSVFRSVDVTVSQDYFEQLVTDNDSDIYVADDDGVIAGYAILIHRWAEREILVPRVFSYIENFGVAEAYRRHGIGRQLIAACVARAKERGASSLELDCWEANQEAVAFYASVGMHMTRRWLAMDI